PDEAIELAQHLARLPRLRLAGFMAIPPVGADPQPHFERLASLGRKLRECAEGAHARHLSMGMTDDFETAVRCGATLVRIGTAIFGERSSTRAGAADATDAD
ncbi:MAG: alanine racemase, partial [Myxococcota bacterium]